MRNNGLAEIAPLLEMFSPQAALQQAAMAQQLISQPRLTDARAKAYEADALSSQLQASTMARTPEQQRFLYEAAGVGAPPSEAELLRSMMGQQEGGDKAFEQLMQILTELQPR
jgi:hypothetical protein